MEKRIKIILIVFCLAMPFFYCGQVCASDKKNVGGLESEPPVWTEFSNALSNSGFETGDGTNWTIDTGCSVTDENAYGGSTYSIKCVNSFGNTRQNSIYIHSSGFKLKGKVFPVAGASGKVAVGIFDNSRSGTAVASKQLDVGEEIIADQWNDFTIEEGQYIYSGLKDDDFQFRIYQYTASGTFYFDNLEFVPLVPLVRTFVKYPNYRGYVWDDESQTVTGTVEANAPEGGDLDDYKAVLSFYEVNEGGSDTLIDTQTLNTFTDKEADFIFDLSGYSNNTEILIKTSLRAKPDNAEVSTFPDWRVVKKAASHKDSLDVYFDSDNKMVQGGIRKFLYGVYDRFSSARCSGCLWTNKNSYLNSIAGFDDLHTIENYEDTRANATIYFSPMSGGNPGFNTSTSDPDDPLTKDASLDNISPWVEALNDHGAGHFHIVHEYHDGKQYRPSWASALTDSQLWKVIATYINQDGFLGYYTSDEPDLYDGRTTKTEGWDIYAGLREYDNGHPTFAVMYNSSAGNIWRNLVDIIGADPYPIGRGVLPTDYLYGDTTSPFMGQIKQYISELEEQVHESRPVIAVLQLFKQTSQSNFPTLNEMRQMAWRAIVEGADGILWWGFVSSSGMEAMWYTLDDYEAYANYKQVSDEIMDLEPILLADDAPDLVACDNPDIDYRVKEYDDKIYIIASNSKDDSEDDVSFTIDPQETVSSAAVLYEERSIEISASTFSDDFSNYGIHLYEIDLGEAPDLDPPVLSSGYPAGILSAGTSQITLSLATDENAICKYGTVSETEYASIANTFTTTGENLHSATITGLADGGSYDYYVRCQDGSDNANEDDYAISFSIALPDPSDTTPPILSSGSPSGNVANSSGNSLSLITDEPAECRYANSAGADYAVMAVFSTTNGTSHTTLLPKLQRNTNYYYYIKCKDSEDNIVQEDYLISFFVSKKTKDDDEDKRKKASSRYIKNHPSLVKKGEALVQWGRKFTKNSTVALYFEKAGGGYYSPVKVKTNSKGYFAVTYIAKKPPGEYHWYAVNEKTGWKSRKIKYKIK
jgi:hypothetical protein